MPSKSRNCKGAFYSPSLYQRAPLEKKFHAELKGFASSGKESRILTAAARQEDIIIITIITIIITPEATFLPSLLIS
jgi:hypothetical protein